MATFLISTTGTLTPVVIDDLGARSFTHPATLNFDLTDEYTMEEIRDSLDLRAAIDAGYLTATLDGEAITDGATFDSKVEDFLNARVTQNEADIVTLQNKVEILEKGGRRLKKVINYVDNTAVPPTENDGDRYILDDTGVTNAAWDGAAALSLVEFNATSGLWEVFDTLQEGDVTYVDAENKDRVYVDDGAPYWELRDGLLEQDATEVPYAPTTPADWDVTPTEVGGALDELAGRVEDLENTPKRSWTYSAGDDGTLGGDRDLSRAGSSTTNVSPFIVPIAGTIWGITIASLQGTNVTFDVQIIKNGSVVHTESVSAADKAFNSSLALAVVAGDEIRVRFIRTAGTVKDLGVEVYGLES